jgi:hypothetical protein
MARKNKTSPISPYAQMQMGTAKMPRVAPRGRLGLNTVLSGNELLNNTNSDASGAVAGTRLLIPGFLSDLSTTGVSTIASYFATGKYLPGTVFHWVPQVSLNTAGVVYVAFTDNVEIISSFVGLATNTLKVAAVKTIANMKSYPVWQTFTFAMPSVSRRKMFDVNSDSLFTPDLLDRGCQGAFLFAVEGTTVSSTICRPYVHEKLMLEGLKTVVT